MKKLRGLRRRQKNIDSWIKHSLQLDIDRLKVHQRDYCKIWVYPWSKLFIRKTPPKDYRNKILNGLLDIYDSWKTQLDALNQPYYLKIWLFEPRFINSQVVCSIGDCLDFYKNTFRKSNTNDSFPLQKFEAINDRLSNYTWAQRFDDDIYSTDDLEYLFPAYRKQVLKKAIVFPTSSGDLFFLKEGNVWLGERTPS